MKTKKILGAIILAICLMFSGIALTACGEDKIEKIESATGVQTTIAVGEQYDTSRITVTVKYASGKTQKIGNSELTFSQINTDEIGDKVLVISYGELIYNVTVHVLNEEDIKNYFIIGYDDPAFVTAWEANSQAQNTFDKTGSNGKKGFAVTGNQYLVGNDNPFVYAPIMHAMFDDNTARTVKKYRAEYNIYLVEDEQSTLLEGDDIADYVTVDSLAHTLQFTDTAIGKTFYISVLPENITADEADIISASTFTFKVVDGYNVYTAADLSILDNQNVNGKWTALKEETGMTGIDANALILQNDISIEAKDVPSVHFYTEEEVHGDTDADRAVGSLKDYANEYLGRIYYRRINSGTFKIEGNYFQISAQNLPLVVREWGEITEVGKSMTTHTVVFDLSGDKTGTNDVNYELNNISFYGNTKKTEDAILSGGALMLKKEDAHLTAYNNLVQCWFITYFGNEGGDESGNYENIAKNTMDINMCNVFDAYNTLVYNYGGVLNINDSILIGAGGPVMICDHVGNNSTTGEGGTISQVTTTNSILESYVVGTEGWFNGYEGAGTYAGILKALDACYEDYNVTVLDEGKTKLNFVAVYKSSSAQGITASNIRGTFAVNDYVEEKQSLIAKLQAILDMAVQQGLDPRLNAEVAQRVLASAGYVGLDMDITDDGFRTCLDRLVQMGEIVAVGPYSAEDIANMIYGTVMGTKISVTKDELLTTLLAMVDQGGLQNIQQAYGIYYFALYTQLVYAKTELATTLGAIKTYGESVSIQFLTDEEIAKIQLYAQHTDMDVSRAYVKKYLEVMHGLGQMTDDEYDAALGAIFVQTSNGAFGLTTTDTWAMTPTQSSALTGATFTTAEDYLYLSLPIGMGIVLGLTNNN